MDFAGIVDSHEKAGQISAKLSFGHGTPNPTPHGNSAGCRQTFHHRILIRRLTHGCFIRIYCFESIDA